MNIKVSEVCKILTGIRTQNILNILAITQLYSGILSMLIGWVIISAVGNAFIYAYCLVTTYFSNKMSKLSVCVYVCSNIQWQAMCSCSVECCSYWASWCSWESTTVFLILITSSLDLYWSNLNSLKKDRFRMFISFISSQYG